MPSLKQNFGLLIELVSWAIWLKPWLFGVDEMGWNMDLADVWFHLSGSSAIKPEQNWHCFILFFTIPYEEIQFRLSNNWLIMLSVLHDKGEGASWVDGWTPN